ncbi:MAG: DNA gyrase subunit A, partial [Acidimicrobiales bacterium]
MEMVREIEEETVEFRPTYDGESTEPVCMPGLLPNLLLNGTSGIAVGMATNMPPHTLREIYSAIELAMNQRRPKPTVDQLMACVPGPDFPSAGIIIDDGIRDAYETGRATLRIRARISFEKLTRNRQAIVITELPYMVSPEKVVKRINELVVADKLQGVVDAKNLSDRKSGLRLFVTLKPNVRAESIVNELYRQTPLEETFGINNVVLVDGVPRTLGLYDLCRHYIDHRLDVVVRRTRYRLQRARDRLHIVEGLIVALDNIDLVVRIIRGSTDAEEARHQLCGQLSLTEIQATHILDMQLRRLTALEKQKIIDERDELHGHIDSYELLLGSEQRQRTLVLRELREIVDVYAVDRRSEITSATDLPVFDAAPSMPDTDSPDTACLVTLSTSGVVGRAPTEGAKRSTPGRHDVMATSCLTSTHSIVHAVTTEGRTLTDKAVDLPEVGGRSRGAPAGKVFGTSQGEEILALVAPRQENLMLVTARGIVKRIGPTELSETRNAKAVINLKGTDKLAAAFTCPGGVDMVMVASDAQTLRTPVDAISIQGRNAAGVAGMKLRAGATVVGAGPAIGDGAIVTVSDIGTAKITPFEELEPKGRGGAGVRLTRFTREKRLQMATVVGPEALLAVMATDDNHKLLDPTPVELTLEPTRRDLVGSRTDRRILAVGVSRW